MLEENKEAQTTPGAAPGNKTAKGGIRTFFSLGEVGNYFFRKKDAGRPSNINLRMMHGVNKLSIIIFLLGVLYMVFKLAIRPNL